MIKRVGRVGGGWHHREGVETVGEYCKKPVQKPVNYLDYVFAKQREKAHRLQKLKPFRGNMYIRPICCITVYSLTIREVKERISLAFF